MFPSDGLMQRTLLRCILLGSLGTGKTSLVKRIVSDTFDPNYYHTIGVDASSLQIRDQTKIVFEDTSGQEQYRSIFPFYVRKANMVIFVFSLSEKQSWADIPYWIDFFNEHSGEDAIQLLVGTKLDLAPDSDSSLCSDFADQNDYPFFQTSSLSGEGITELKNRIIAEAENFSQGKRALHEASFPQRSGKSSSSCC